MPAFQVAIGQDSDIKLKVQESFAEWPHRPQSSPKLIRQMDGNRSFHFPCFLGLFFQASAPHHPCHPGRTKSGKFSTGFRCSDFLEGRKTPIKNVCSGWMVASSSLWCQRNESRIPSPLPKSQWLVIKFPLTVCFITSVSLLTYNGCCWEVQLVNDFLLHIDISTWRGNISSSECDYYFEMLSTGGKSVAIN